VARDGQLVGGEPAAQLGREVARERLAAAQTGREQPARDTADQAGRQVRDDRARRQPGVCLRDNQRDLVDELVTSVPEAGAAGERVAQQQARVRRVRTRERDERRDGRAGGVLGPPARNAPSHVREQLLRGRRQRRKEALFLVVEVRVESPAGDTCIDNHVSDDDIPVSVARRCLHDRPEQPLALRRAARRRLAPSPARGNLRTCPSTHRLIFQLSRVPDKCGGRTF